MTDYSDEQIAALVQRLREEAGCLMDAVTCHKAAFAPYIRNNGKRSVCIVEDQLNKTDLGYEHRLLADAADALASLQQAKREVQRLINGALECGNGSVSVEDLRKATEG